MVGRTATRTQAADLRGEIIYEIGCLPCLIDGWPCVDCQINHLLIGGERHEDEHRHTDGECPWHHQGHPVPAHCCGSIEEATEHHGPSRRHDSKAFHKRYGNDDDLLALQDAMINEVLEAWRDGEFLTPTDFTKMVRSQRRQLGMVTAWP